MKKMAQLLVLVLLILTLAGCRDGDDERYEMMRANGFKEILPSVFDNGRGEAYFHLREFNYQKGLAEFYAKKAEWTKRTSPRKILSIAPSGGRDTFNSFFVVYEAKPQ